MSSALFPSFPASALTNETAALSGPSNQTYNMVLATVSSVPDRIKINMDNGSMETGVNSTADEDTVRIGRITIFKKELQPMCDIGSIRKGEGEAASCGEKSYHRKMLNIKIYILSLSLNAFIFLFAREIIKVRQCCIHGE